ncbi:LacI family DNA-binding transcriptional regulator [Tritonibacter mobilis]|nr:LacI family DNA-binding transcriptional regulator [Tritonibacter mobilis]
MKPVTLKQIAEHLNISVTTVSKALKDYPDVSKKTKRLVREYAKILNYKPNTFAVNLRTKESKTIGLIIPEIVHHFFQVSLKGLFHKPKKRLFSNYFTIQRELRVRKKTNRSFNESASGRDFNFSCQRDC